MAAVDYIKHYTHNDYKKWKGDWELYEGFPVALQPAAIIKHQSLVANIIFELQGNMNDCEGCFVLGGADYKLSDDTIFRPDVALICDEPHDAYITKAPEIVVEVLSPSTAKNDEGYKFQKYGAELVKYYILVYPHELYAKIYKLTDGKYRKQGDFSTESYDFKETLCKASVNFEKVFKRFRT